MKPFVVYINGDTNKIILTKEEFEKTLNEAYKQGHEDGYNKGLVQGRSYSGWWNSPQITTNEIRYDTASQPKPNPITITCDNNKNVITAKNNFETLYETFKKIGD